MENFETYEVGKKYEQYRINKDDIRFDITDSGAKLVVCFRGLKQEEIEQFKSGHNIEFRFLSLYDIIIICVKIGTLNWMDAPYSIHLSPNLTTLLPVKDGEGLSVQLILFDSETGELKALRLVGLSTKFTQALFKELKEQNEKPFNKTEYYNNLCAIYNRYSTNQLVKMARTYYKIDY